MILSHKIIIGMSVETKSKQALGHIRDFDLDTDTLELANIYVRPSGIVKGLVVGDLIISKSSIISINEEKIIVDDLTERELVKEDSRETMVTGESPASAMIME
ncbi:MAG: hypothetical protein COU51_00725 [Parcubacteria group bacterium CG10_big_fil_rev_8_21_14_0_10_36_14]|nr:MAG: hypothetical protein COU51_00725 [Parcubacteria group bacterium CG10_big_fil_rev_8_21_14_0_10_36_14]